MQQPDIREYLQALKSSRKFGPQIVFHKILSAARPRFAATKRPLHPAVKQALEHRGITELYTHQAEAVDAIRNGATVIVATPTASGKSLIYNIPVLQRHFEDETAHALYLFPLKALSQDQYAVLNTLYKGTAAAGEGGSEISAIYDGDTPSSVRARLRLRPPPVLITNPDMLHLSLLPFHDSWSGFFKRLEFVVIDEIHTYRGLFGSHMAWVLRRLQRLARHYGASPQFILLSATIGNPEQLGSLLTDTAPIAIRESGAPQARKHFLFINPWDSPAHTAAQLLEAAVKRGLRTIVYTKSRKMTELITMWTRPRLAGLAHKVSSYRAGFLPEERRTIEADLSGGRLLGVISTSALELGIDIGDLDLCILVGYPGSIMATWQRGGRVGRGQQESAIIFIGGQDALDQHFMRNPNDFFARAPENAALNPLNSHIAQPHLHCAAAELPLSGDEPLVAASSSIQQEIEELTQRAILYRDHSGSCWYASRKRPQRSTDLRGGGLQLAIIQQESGEIIGEIDSGRSLKEAHPGAIYLHHARTRLVQKLDISAGEVVVSDVSSTYFTRPTVHKHTAILAIREVKPVFGATVSWGMLQVTEKITGFQKVNNVTQKTISTEPLDLPEQVIETEGLWLDLPDSIRTALAEEKMHFMGAIHALEHAMIALFPLLVLCDRNDIGGISCPKHEQTGAASIFIYDGCPGGAGLARSAFEMIDDLLLQTEHTVRMCGCENGCPSCVHSPKCGSGNRPIDKVAALRVLQLLFAASGETAEQNLPERSETTAAAGEGGVIRQPAVSVDAEIWPEGLAALPGRYCVFDLETKRSADEAGGWSRADRMGMSMGVVYDSSLEDFVVYLEDEIDELIDHLFRADLVVGFNTIRFDYRVLSAYTTRDLSALPSLDLLAEIMARLGYRLSLNRLAGETLGAAKSGDGLQALKWYKEGNFRALADYCRHDVEITRDLLLYGLENGFLLFRNKAGASVRLPLALDKRIGEIAAGAP